MVRVKIDTTWPATRVGLRPVKSCLGGHEAGVLGVGEGVEKTSIPMLKRGRMALSECATFMAFIRVENDYDCKKRNGTYGTIPQETVIITYDAI